MRIYITTTKKCCPVCHTVLETDNSEFLAIVFMPFILMFFVFAIPYFIARWILFELVLCVDIPKICKNPIIECPNCGAKVRISNNNTYNELNKEDKLIYDNRVLLRAAYFFGGTLLYGVLFSFFLAFNDELGKIFGWIGFSSAFLCLFIVIAIVYYWKTHKADNYNKNNGQSKSANNQQNAHGLSPNLNFEKNKEISSTVSADAQAAEKSEQDIQQYLALIEKCGIGFFIKYYRQISRLPLKDVDVTENYSSAEREERLLAAKKIIDNGLSELALSEIIRAYDDILDKEVIDRAKELLDEIRK